MIIEQLFKKYASAIFAIFGFKRINNYEDEKIKIDEFIHAPKRAKYLSEFLEELPPNTFINKAATGVGATTMALRSDEKYIVAVPYQNLADNKKEWCDINGVEVLVVKSGITKEDIENYQGAKILVVYDSLWKLTEYLKDRKSFRLLVDEVHVILTSAIFRGKGMNTVLKHFRNFKDFVLITATPTYELYSLDEFKDIKKIEIVWPDKEKINFIRDVVDSKDDYSVEDKLILICRQHLEGDIKSNAYFFVNSVRIITKVVRVLIKLKLINADQVNLIVAEGNTPNLKVDLGKEYSIGKPPSKNSKPKKLNFITSTAFEGSDFYDENGKIYVISDGSRSHTKIDIMTQLHQIAGRIRDSKLNKSIQIITVPTSLNLFNISKEEFKASVEAEYKNWNDLLKIDKQSLNDNIGNEFLYETISLRMLRLAELNPCYIIEDGFVEMNVLYIPAQMHGWKVMHQSYIYSINADGESEIVEGYNNGIEFTDEKIKLPPYAIGNGLLGRDTNFREVLIMYIKARKEEAKVSRFQFVNGEYVEDNNLSVQIEKISTLIPEAYRILGTQRLANLNYNKSKIMKAIDEKAPINNVAKHIKIKAKWYSMREIKNKLQLFYDKTDTKLKAKATDIRKYYVVVEKSKMVSGKLVKGFEIKARIRLEKKIK